MSRHRIITVFTHPPIPVRDMDWQAQFDGDEPNDAGQMAVGHGRTESAAITDLLANAVAAPEFVWHMDAAKGLIVIRREGKVAAVVDDVNPDIADTLCTRCNAYAELAATLRDIAKRAPYIGGDECAMIAEKALKDAGIK